MVKVLCKVVIHGKTMYASIPKWFRDKYGITLDDAVHVEKA